MQAAVTATISYQRVGHLNCKSLDLLKKMDNIRVSFDGTVPLQHVRQPYTWCFSGDLHIPDGILHARGALGLEVCFHDLRRASQMVRYLPSYEQGCHSPRVPVVCTVDGDS